MLDLNPEIVCFIILKAREFHAKEQVTIPDEPSDASDDWAAQVLADHVGDMTYQEFRSAVNDLEPDQQVSLVALMWVGRGDFSADEWDDATAEARNAWTESTADYLIARPLVADYLEEGLAEFGYSCDT